MPIQDATAAADALQDAIASLGADHELRPVLREVRQFVLAQGQISAGKEALLSELRAIAEQLAGGALATREVRAEVARMAAALGDLQRLEADRGARLGPLVEAVTKRVAWAVWLQSPGRGQQLAYLISLTVLAAAAVAGNPTALATLGRIIGIGQ